MATLVEGDAGAELASEPVPLLLLLLLRGGPAC